MALKDPMRLTVEEFFAWQEHVEGRYELVDGHIVPHPDYVTLEGLAAPSNEHAAIAASLGAALSAQVKPPCRVYVGPGAVVDGINANVPDVAVSSDPDDRTRAAGLLRPRFVFEILSPPTARIDRGRKVAEYLAIEGLEAYVILDPVRRSMTIHRTDDGPYTYAAALGSRGIVLGEGIELSFDVFD